MTVIYLAGTKYGHSYIRATAWRDDVAKLLGERGLKSLSPLPSKLYDSKTPVIGYPKSSQDSYNAFMVEEALMTTANAFIFRITSENSVGTIYQLGFVRGLRKPTFVQCPTGLLSHPVIEAGCNYASTEMTTILNLSLAYFGQPSLSNSESVNFAKYNYE